MPVLRHVKYQCSQANCKETDTAKFWDNEPTLPVINCWSCHSGYPYETQQRLAQHIGMYPTK